MKISLRLSLLLAGLLCPLPGTFLPVNLSKLTTILFIPAMFSLFLALMAFLRQVITATRALRVSSTPRPRGKSSAKPLENGGGSKELRPCILESRLAH
jgi:hypothetical protein